MMRIGEFLVRCGALTSRQVDEILHVQVRSRFRYGTPTLFGTLALERGLIDEADLGRWIEAKALIEEVAKGRATWPTAAEAAPSPATAVYHTRRQPGGRS